MTIPSNAILWSFSVDGPIIGMGWTQSTFTGGPVSFLGSLTVAAPDISANDFRLVTVEGNVTGDLSLVADPNSASHFLITVDNIAGEGGFEIVPVVPMTEFNNFGRPIVVIDSTASAVLSTTLVTPSGTYGTGAQIEFEVHFDERVGVKGAPALLLSNGAEASYSVGSGTSTLHFTYTVKPGDNATDLRVAGFSSHDASTNDVAGNAIDWTALTAGSSGGIDIQADPVTPLTITSVTASLDAGDAGKSINRSTSAG